MKMLIAWMIAVSFPSSPEYVFLSTLFNNEEECVAAISKIEVESPGKAECVRTAVMTPKKPIDV